MSVLLLPSLPKTNQGSNNSQILAAKWVEFNHSATISKKGKMFPNNHDKYLKESTPKWVSP